MNSLPKLHSKPIDRRSFFKLSGMGVLGAALPLGLIGCSPVSREKVLPYLSMQLYTVRNEIARDLQGTLRRLAEIGFTHVETAFWPEGVSHREGAGYLRDAGLAVSSIHAELPENGDRNTLLELTEIYGSNKVIWHGWPEDPRYSSYDGTMELVSVYNDVSDFARENGLEFGLHNHWWEFQNRAGNRIPYQILADELHEDVFFQVDIYWVKVAGLDPAAVIRELGSRVKMLHVKDGPANPDDISATEPHEPMTAVGNGTLDIPSVMEAASGYAEWLVIEMDEVDGDVFTKLQDSFNYLIENNYAKLK
jgi:sugar phosphate isomerase/epimerase